MTLGAYLQAARRQAGYSLRRLARETGIHLSSIYRLMSDDIDNPSAANLINIAKVLKLNPAEMFAHAGISAPPTDLDAVLRTEYGLPDEAIAQIHTIIVTHSTQKAERP
ncbi:helix-turn-helix domain-containing protein [Nonomuraea sp. NPDC059023]|uniref:helix-turn-helix domain-containing protein n=1 Tax=unclassified Nonomuraea TaxID=2593643 RepID=UPI0036CEBBD9